MRKFSSHNLLKRVVFFLLCGVSVASFAQDTLRIGIIRYKTPELVQETFLPLFDKVATQFGKVVSLDLVDEEELGYLLMNHRYDIGIFPPFPYLRSKADFPELEVFGSHLIEGESQFTGAILTQASSPISTLEELAGKHMVFVKPTSTSGFLFPKGILQEHQIDLEAGDVNFEFSGGHDLSLYALTEGKTDAIAIDKQVVSDMDSLMDQVKTLFTYHIPYHAYVFSPKLNVKEKEKLQQIMFGAHKNPQARKLFQNNLGITQWVPQSDAYYNPLRRYLRFARIKPTLKIRIQVKDQATASLQKKGDLIDLVYDNIANDLRETHRFLVTDITHQNHFHDLRLVVSMIDKKYHIQAYLDEKRIEYFTEVSQLELIEEVPKGITQALLKSFPIQCELLNRGEEWFITYGTDDGVDTKSYVFDLVKENGMKISLGPKTLERMDLLNTFFFPNESFEKGDKIRIVYAGEEWQTSLNSSMPEEAESSVSFWDDKDNQWGVIGLVVTLIGVIVGSFFTKRKKKRFRNMLYESNKLLLEYIRGRYRLDNEILAHKDKINQFLEKGYISENQYLILRNRIEDIHKLIHQIMNNPEELERSIREEVEQIIEDGEITEKEYSRLVSIVQQKNRE
ncbi:MAG: PhnD/SsuA/transferrin family substrate-binding protein [Bacteroidota bacterium]